MNALVQLAIVAAIMGWSLLFMLRRQFPQTARMLQQRLSKASLARGWTALGHWLQPAEKMNAGCGNGCRSCSPSCASDKVAVPEQAVQWRQPPGACH